MTNPANTSNSEKTKDFSKFLKGVRSELKKVNWPTKQELINNSVLTIVTVSVATLALWALDSAFGFGLNLIIR